MGLDTVPYDKIVSTATKISEKGKILSTHMKSAWTTVNSMHGQWDGDRWNSIATAFNDVEQSINKLLKYITESFSKELESIGTAYSTWDTGSSKDATISTAETVQQLDTGTKGEGRLTFDLETITSLRQQANTSFNACSDDCNDITSIFTGLSGWTGSTADEYKAKVNSMNAKVQADLDKLRDDFDKAMQQTISSYEKIKTQIDSKKSD